MTSSSGFTIVDFTIPTRDVPVVHPCAEAPICSECRSQDMCFFDPMCSGCQEVLSNPKTTISEIFAIMRQWVPQTQGHLNLLTREILRRGAHINDKDGLTDLSVLHYACKAGADGMGNTATIANLVNSLINKGADTSLKCHWTDMNALHYAVLFDCHLVVDQLCQHNPALVCTVSGGGNALHIAAANLCLQSAKVLIKHNCDGGLKDNDGRLPQDCIPKAVGKKEEGTANEMLELLKEAAANRPQLTKGRIRHSSSNTSVSSLAKSPISTNTTKSPTITKSPTVPTTAAKSPVGKLSSAKNKLAVTETSNDVILNGSAPAISREDSKDSRSSSRPSPSPNSGLGTSPDDITLDTLGIKVGDRVVIDAGTSKSKRGTLRFAGVTMFASGQWAGIELDDDKGKNDGSQGGIRYFSCKPKRGLFVSLKRITKYSTPTSKAKKPTLAERGKSDSVRSVESPSHLASEYKIGDRVKVSGIGTGTLRFSGDVTFAPGIWLGVELDRPLGNTNGSKGGHEYFKCRNNYGTFVLPSKVSRIVESADASTTPPAISVTPPTNRRKQPTVTTKSGTPRTKTHSYTSPVPSSLSLASAPDPVLEKGMTVFVNKEKGTLHFIGQTDFAPGTWLGVELKKPCGKNDGSVNGKRYFSCKQGYGIFVKPEKATHRGFNCSKLIRNDRNM